MLSENLKNRVSINNIIIKKSISYLFFLSFLFISFHGINIVLAAPQEVGLYDVFEIEVINTKVYSNPFDYTVIELQATFTNPSGKQIPFFGFYDGDGNGEQIGNVWKLRFMPNEIGTWTYTYMWTDGTPGGSGSFDVVDTGLPGTLQIATDNSWYLENSRGEPIHWRGYNMHLWKHWGYSSDFNDVMVMDELENVVDAEVVPNGYNGVMILGPGYIQKEGHNWWYYDGTTTDLDRFDISTWATWDRYINIYHKNEIYVFPFSLIAQWDVNTVGNARIEQFYRYFVARNAGYYNLFGYGLTWEWPELWSEPTVTSWMSNPYSWNPYSTLLTSHDSMRESFKDWGGLSMRQHQSNDIFDGNSRTVGQHGGVQGSFINKPIIASEDTWIGQGYSAPQNADESRRGMWGAALAGILTVYSEWDEFSPDGDGTGEADALYMYNFIYSNTNYRQYQQLNSIVSSSARQICSGIPGQEYLVYDENGGSITIDLSGTSPADSFSVLWFDPKTGEERSGGTINGGAYRTLTTPFSGDTVLLLGGGATDATSPTVEQVTASDPNKVKVFFLEAMEEYSATDISNYAIDNGITISSASLGSDLKTVTLATSTHTEGIPFTLTVNNVKDRASVPNTIAPNTQVTYQYVKELMISNIIAASGKIYENDKLDTGKLQYIDRDYTFSSVPSAYINLKYIRTANDDKGSTANPCLEFDVTQDVTVYVAHDDRISLKPSWLASFTDTGDDLVGGGVTFSLYANNYSAGHISLGGNSGDSYSMYNVVLKPITDSTLVNNPPELEAIGDKIVDEGQALTFTLSATDADGDVLTYSATNLPTGATFNSITRAFCWTPDENQAGSYQVHFVVTDGSLIDAEDVTITVNSAAVEVTLTLYEGWNLIALPVINNSFTASSLASAIGDVSYIMDRNASDGGYQEFIVGFSGDADDFVISPGEGYYMYLDVVQKDFTIRGIQADTWSIDLVEGWNLVGWTSPDPSDAVAALVDPLGSKIKYAAKRNSPYGDYEEYIVGFSEPEDNFDVEPGHGYFVYVTSNCTLVHD